MYVQNNDFPGDKRHRFQGTIPPGVTSECHPGEANPLPVPGHKQEPRSHQQTRTSSFPWWVKSHHRAPLCEGVKPFLKNTPPPRNGKGAGNRATPPLPQPPMPWWHQLCEIFAVTGTPNKSDSSSSRPIFTSPDVSLRSFSFQIHSMST